MKNPSDPCLVRTQPAQKHTMTKQGASEGVLIYIVEELGDARLRCAQLKKYVKEATDLIEKSGKRDHFFEVAGHLIHGIPDVLLRLDNALSSAAMGVSRLDYEEIKNGLRPEKADELENVLQDVRLRYLNRRSDTQETSMARTTHLEGHGGHTLCGERIYPDTVVDSVADATCFYCVTAWEKAHAAGTTYSRHLRASTKDTTMNTKTAAYFLNKLAELTDKGGRVPTRALQTLIAKLEGQTKQASALAPKAATAFRKLAEEITSQQNPSRVKLAGVLRRILADTQEMESAQGKQAVAPPEWEGTVKEMKDHPEIDNPWALAWYMKGKGMTPHKEGSKLTYDQVKTLRKIASDVGLLVSQGSEQDQPSLQQMDQQAGAGEDFQKVNPKITDEEVEMIDEMHDQHKEQFKSASWLEKNDAKGRRWVFKGQGDVIDAAHIQEIQGPGIPLYVLKLLLPDGTMLKAKKNYKKLSDAQRDGATWIKADGEKASLIFTDFIKI